MEDTNWPASLAAQIDRHMQAARPLAQILEDSVKFKNSLQHSVRFSEELQRVRDIVVPGVRMMEEIERNRQLMMPISSVLQNLQHIQENNKFASVFAEMERSHQAMQSVFQTTPLFLEMKKTNESMLAMQQMVDQMRVPEYLTSILQSTDKLQSVYLKVNEFNGVHEIYGGIRPIDHERARQKVTIDAYLGGQKNLAGHRLSNEKFFEIDYNLSVVTDIKEESGRIITPPYIIKEAKNIKAIIAEVYRTNSKLFNITPRQFEELVCELLQKRGFRVELTKQTRDGGRDIIAMSYDNMQSELKYLIECKRWAERKKVDVNVIRSFCYTLSQENANKGIIFTTSSFTSVAQQERTKFGPLRLDFREYADIIQWVSDYIIGFNAN